ncbi:UNVERIFIED_CONTAM: Clathrin interactor EPSIN 2 [Sesamum calycinum]|uniref:Clathrin interactor EPSIN 2 n=1 Tax=Sesamum calycinum TaxID=2727403 RepID=A0AAW2J0H9_9LAMI
MLNISLIVLTSSSGTTVGMFGLTETGSSEDSLELENKATESNCGKDQGNNVRKKSQSLVVLVSNRERIQEVRQKAAANRDK